MLRLFCDASGYPQHDMGVGGFICLAEKQLQGMAALSLETLLEFIAQNIHYIKFQSGKSTWCEINTLIAALQQLLISKNLAFANTPELIVYTDCQTIVDLLGARRAKLERKNYLNRHAQPLANANLYRELYAITDKFHLTIIKLKGHEAIAEKINIEQKIFSCVDKLVRRKLRSNG